MSLLLVVAGLPAGFLSATICNSVVRGELFAPGAFALFAALPVVATLSWGPLWIARWTSATRRYTDGAFRPGARRWPHALEMGGLVFAAMLFALGFGAVMSWPD